MLLFVYRRGGGCRTRLLVNEEASSNSRGIGGEGSGQAAVSGGTGFQIFQIIPHTLSFFLWLLIFCVVTFCLQERRRRLDQTLYHIRGVDVLFRWSLGTN